MKAFIISIATIIPVVWSMSLQQKHDIKKSVWNFSIYFHRLCFAENLGYQAQSFEKNIPFRKKEGTQFPVFFHSAFLLHSISFPFSGASWLAFLCRKSILIRVKLTLNFKWKLNLTHLWFLKYESVKWTPTQTSKMPVSTPIKRMMCTKT